MDKAVNENDLIQLITGACSPAQRKRVEKWLEEHSENREQLRKLRQTWEISGNLELHQNEDETWEKISRRISNPSHLTIHRSGNKEVIGEENEGDAYRNKNMHPEYTSLQHSRSWFSSVAIACLLLMGSLFLLYEYGFLDKHNPFKETAMQQVTADRGERMNLTLSDGTSVVLNSLSTIRYPSDFNGQSREIELEGEAFFSVAPNENSPFLVHADDAVIRVLGTKFNISAYADFDGVEVVVEEGKVAVRSDSLTSTRQQGEISNEVTLGAGEYTIVREGRAPVSPVSVALDHHLGWINGDLIFEATPLDVVIKKLERYYNRDFEVTDPALLNHKLTVSFKKESLSKVLDVLSIAMDITYEQRDSLIYLEPYESHP